jgi:hypothetical protein
LAGISQRQFTLTEIPLAEATTDFDMQLKTSIRHSSKDIHPNISAYQTRKIIIMTLLLEPMMKKTWQINSEFKRKRIADSNLSYASKYPRTCSI